MAYHWLKYGAVSLLQLRIGVFCSLCVDISTKCISCNRSLCPDVLHLWSERLGATGRLSDTISVRLFSVPAELHSRRRSDVSQYEKSVE